MTPPLATLLLETRDASKKHMSIVMGDYPDTYWGTECSQTGACSEKGSKDGQGVEKQVLYEEGLRKPGDEETAVIALFRYLKGCYMEQ